MAGMKSGTGDDLWGDDTDQEAEEDGRRDDRDDAVDGDTDSAERSEQEPSDALATDDGSERIDADSSRDAMPLVVERAVRDEGIQFRRDDRLTFFVRSEVAAGERDLVSTLENELDRDLPKMDVREAAYQVAQEQPQAVLQKLVEMGYEHPD